MLSVKKLKMVRRGLKQNLRVYQCALRNPETPWPAKFLLWLAVGYILSPLDLIPDFIPIIGHLDDAVIVPFLVLLALKLIPEKVIDDCRQKVNCI